MRVLQIIFIREQTFDVPVENIKDNGRPHSTVELEKSFCIDKCALLTSSKIDVKPHSIQ